ncbi:phage terminase large subunit family protein [Ferrimonas balearica]|uniref:phage terminase large subunit family protein n=1 Tax=Ferrimonas balearica TaxID=44012 RepID=UPI001C98A63F|nr:terminase gpA endonuclease subunit [Ferrimonas balearica]MBY6104898.1 phage terminase large subunit family protein [Ferrimonas balearica]
MTAVEWADEHFYLSAESSYVEGRWETLPFQVAILNAMGNDEIREVNLIKSARVGYSQMLKAALAYLLQHKQRNQLLLQPTDAAAAGFMKAHIETMIRDVPTIKALAPWHGKKHRDNTMDTKRFSNRRQLWCLGGTAAKNYREKSVDTVIYDELAAFPHDVEKEGSPTFLGDKRLEGSVFGKSIRGSTPKIKGECQIERAAIESGNLLRFWLPCPHCDEYQPLKWGGPEADHGLKWQADDSASVGYLCPHCGAIGTYAEWMPQQKRGEWRDPDADLVTSDGIDWHRLDGRRIAVPESVSFHVWTAYSPFTDWSRVVQGWLKAKGDIGKLKTFVNTTLGETWEEAGERIEHHELYRRREHYPAQVPAGALVLTCAVDTQDDRLECEVVGWGFGDERWSVDFQIFHGDPSRQELWDRLDQYLQQTWQHESGNQLRIACTCIDSGGHFTQQVYAFVKPREGRRIFAIKGKGGVGRPIVSRPSTANKGKIKLFSVGVDTAKELTMARLQVLEPGPGYCHWPVVGNFDEEFFKQLTAEERRTRYHKGHAVREWVKTRSRNEAFDLAVYNLAAREILNPNYEALADKVNAEPDAAPPKRRRRMKMKGF